jgi:hypothetical protein
MSIIRRLLTAAVAISAVAGIASADEIISYTTTPPVTTATDFSNLKINLPAWDPGGTVATYDYLSSDGSGPYSGLTGFLGGVSMNSLAGDNAVLVSYDIYVNSNLVGTFQGSAGAAGAQGNFHIDNYTAVSLSTMGSLAGQIDPANDLFNVDGSTIDGGGPDPKTASGAVNLSANQLSSVYNVNQTQASDYGCFLAAPDSRCTTKGPFVSGGLASVKTPDPLNIYLSSITSTDQSLTGGNFANTYNMSDTETVTVAYDFTTSSGTPEPTTMVLFGSALVGLGLLRKRVRQQ